jgi:hypothetical protein
MAGELVRWLAATPAERDRDRAVQKAHDATDVALARVSGISQVSQAAMFGTSTVCMMKRETAMLLPEDAAKFDFIATEAAVAMAAEIHRLAGR